MPVKLSLYRINFSGACFVLAENEVVALDTVADSMQADASAAGLTMRLGDLNAAGAVSWLDCEPFVQDGYSVDHRTVRGLLNSGDDVEALGIDEV